MYGRRRGSAPAAVLRQTLQHFQDGKGSRIRSDSNGKQLPTTVMPKQYKIHEKKGKKEPHLEKFRNGFNEKNFLSDPESCSSRLAEQDVTPSTRGRSDKLKKLRYGRKETQSAAISREFCTPFYYTSPSKNFASIQKKSSSSKDYHIVLLGQCGVGKSALLVRFTTGRFIHEYDPFLEMTYEVCVDIDEDASMLHITDTASTHEPVYLNQNEGFIVVYAVDDFRTFETAKQLVKLVREMKKQKGKHCSIALVGNKMDLRHSRVVSTSRARGFAMEHECIFYEVSAAKDVNVKVIFHDTIRQLRLLQLSRKSNQGPMDSIKKIFHKIKTDDKSRPSQEY